MHLRPRSRDHDGMAIKKRKKAAARPRSVRAASEKRPDEKLVEKTLELL